MLLLLSLLALLALASAPASVPKTVGGMSMAKGTVKWFNRAKGYGFIEPEDGSKDVFVHISAVIEAGMDTLQEGQKIEYELMVGQNDRQAAGNLVALEE